MEMVLEDGSLLIATPFDPLFLLLAHWWGCLVFAVSRAAAPLSADAIGWRDGSYVTQFGLGTTTSSRLGAMTPFRRRTSDESCVSVLVPFSYPGLVKPGVSSTPSLLALTPPHRPNHPR